MISRTLKMVCICSLVLFLDACSEKHEHEHAAHEKTLANQPVTNRIQLSPGLISSSGITFRTVRSGKLGSWISVPGKVEVPREKQYLLKAPAVGRVFWKIERLTRVQKGKVIATIESSALSEAQQELAASQQVLSIAKKRRGDDQGSVVRFEQAERKYRERLGRMSVLTGIPSAELARRDQNGKAHWVHLSKLELLAPGDGVLFEKNASDAELVEAGGELGRILNLQELVFRGLVAANLFSEIPEGAAVRIEAGDNQVIESRVSGPFPVGDMQTGKVWIEAHVSNENRQFAHGLPAIANVQIQESEFEEAIVPEECIIFDALQAVLFKRDTAESDIVIRTPVEIGNRSGGQIEVFTGVMAGDEIVCEGIHQIKHLGAGNAPQGGHFHADGTWHDGKE